MKKSIITLFLADVSGDPPMSPCAKVSTQDSEIPFTHVRDCRGTPKQPSAKTAFKHTLKKGRPNIPKFRPYDIYL